MSFTPTQCDEITAAMKKIAESLAVIAKAASRD